MIKASELRQGNLVDYEATTHVVTGIVNNSIYSRWLKNQNDEYCDSDANHNPIPLTTEILEKSGFKKRDERTFCMVAEKHCRFECYWNSLANEVHAVGIQTFEEDFKRTGVQNFTWHLKYVHQLQNLFFALTGEELPIQLTT